MMVVWVVRLRTEVCRDLVVFLSEVITLVLEVIAAVLRSWPLTSVWSNVTNAALFALSTILLLSDTTASVSRA